jgi:hypothetical protein
MRRPRALWRWVAAGLAVAGLGGAAAFWLTHPDPGDPRLNAFVHAAPPVPVVFTSRSEPTSLVAAAPSGEGFTEPGQRLWAAREGRLRLLTPAGTVRELTWGKPLPDGGTLIDVMSPSVSLDGKRVLFAGRRADGHGRFRLYEVGVNGSGLRQLTGGPDDPGCEAVPPLRWRADGSRIPDAERRAADYDDVDPVELNFADGRIAFVSTRTPDLGRDHARRSTTLWVRHADGHAEPVTGNRNNDRWPFLLSSGYLAFSLWSRNREVVPADRGDLRPYEDGMECATRPTDAWLGAFAQLPGGHFGMLVKPAVPVWRPRPLFANRIAFMTTLARGAGPDDDPPLTVVQAPPGLLANSPSSAAPEHPLPAPERPFLRLGPDRDAAGRPLRLATPSPCPPGHVLMAGAVGPGPGAYALYLAGDDWPEGTAPADAATIGLRLLFDDPDLVDAEPVAVYERPFHRHEPPTPPARDPLDVRLADGRVYRGPSGSLLATGLDGPNMMTDLPGQRTDAGQGPVFDGPPAGAIDHLRIYAARRDRFDDPDRPRVPGGWELLLALPVKDGHAGNQIPTDVPTVLAGYDKAGRVVRWTTAARDAAGKSGTFYAYAGDHYSLSRPDGKTFCVGCHAGHSGLPATAHEHAERVR